MIQQKCARRVIDIQHGLLFLIFISVFFDHICTFCFRWFCMNSGSNLLFFLFIFRIQFQLPLWWRRPRDGLLQLE